MLDFNELCKELQNKYESLIDLIHTHIYDIWKEEITDKDKSINTTHKEIIYKSDYSKLGK